jgi:hypothetical protein
LYICSDTSNIYLGTLDLSNDATSDKLIRIAANTDEAIHSVNSDNAINAERIINSANKDAYYDYNKLEDLSELIKDINNIIFDGLGLATPEDDNTRAKRLAKILDDAEDEKMPNGDDLAKVTIKHAKFAESAEDAENATNAEKASKDINERALHYNYYRINDDNIIESGLDKNDNKPKVITFSTQGPSGGNIGDIWIQYS